MSGLTRTTVTTHFRLKVEIMPFLCMRKKMAKNGRKCFLIVKIF